MPQLNPSTCLGVLAMMINGVSDCRIGGAMCLSEYHWRRVVWMCLAVRLAGYAGDRSDGMCDC
jgi:hypothetical protein